MQSHDPTLSASPPSDETTAPARADGEPPYPPSRRAWAVVWLLLAIYTVAFIDRQILALLVGPIKRDMDVSDLEFGLLTGVSFAVFYTLFGIPFARIADSRSRRGLIAFGITFWSLATALCGMARSYPQLFLARIGVGIGEATLSPAATSLLSDLFPPERRGRAISVYALGIPLGSALAFLFGGAVIEMVDTIDSRRLPLIGEVRGWQLSFLIVGLPGLLLAAAMAFVPEPFRRGRQRQSGTLTLRETMDFFVGRRRVYLPAFLGIACLSALGYGTVYFIGAFFGRVHGFSPGETGLAFGLILLVAGTGGILFAGWLTDRWVARGHADAHIRVLVASVLLGAPFALAFPLMPTAALAIALLSIGTFFTNFVWGTAYAGVAAVTPNEVRGQATALYLFVVNLVGLGLGPPMFGLFTTVVFADDSMIDLAYVAVPAILMPATLTLLLLVRPAFARQYREVAARESRA